MPPLPNTISLREEMISFETLWSLQDQTQQRLFDLFRTANATPSQALEQLSQQTLFRNAIDAKRAEVGDFLAGLSGFSVSVRGAFQYPDQLSDAEDPIALFYYRGEIALAQSQSVAVVGTRKASLQGTAAAEAVSRALVEDGITVVSGLAAGIDTASMRTVLRVGGRTIGVIGTPINKAYPQANKTLQERIAKDHLLMSEVPFYRYRHQAFATRRYYFPRRNEIMAALSEATVIVEASETSGTRTQARACKKLGRTLILMSTCVDQPGVSWPRKLIDSGDASLATTAAQVIELLRRSPRAKDDASVEENRPG